ncbi:MFS transporter [Streptomyces sp. GESEQ-35]|uniref:MFS transporter n=1 Tax=Streptomyces sp. GESEQ-35 TaxID=2812657 RepID=UPI001B3289AF
MFFVNVVPALVFGVLALAVRQPRRPASRTALDLPGALLLAVALACLVHTLVSGWTAASALGLVAAALFVWHERRAVSPLLPPDLIRSPAVGSALGILVTASAALSGTLFVGTYVLQDGLGLDPFQSALRSLPLAVLMVAAAPMCAVLLRRAGARRTTVGAMAVLALGILVLAGASDTLALCTGFALLGAGFGTVMVAATHVVVRQAAVASAGVAGGLQQTAMNIGPTVGVAVATPLMGFGPGLPLAVLAVVASAGAVVGLALPVRSDTSGVNRARRGGRIRIPTRP